MQIDVIGVPLDYGAGRRGVDMGPAAVRHAGLFDKLRELGHDVNDRGNMLVPIRENAEVGEPGLRYLGAIVPVMQSLADSVEQSVKAGGFPVVIGGDHSVALGSIGGHARARNIGVVWIDTHGDWNTPQTSPSGNIHGMPMAALCGYGDPRLTTIGTGDPAKASIDPRKVALVGTRDLDPGERKLMQQAGVSVFSMESIDRYGIADVMEAALKVATAGTDGIHVSFDLDVLDPQHAPGVGTPVPGGLTVREAHLAMEMLSGSGMVRGLDVVEVNPILDERNRTAELAVVLSLSCLGLRVWPNAPALGSAEA
ncbi:MAG TPA: arginase [Longimicrobium sp.]|jgi:arginase|uniref:arginase n=1 Tax=Longimicrobium sp. TaxID=2029185 RepID=UPI002ED89578